MSSTPFDSGALGPLLSDAETRELFNDQAAVDAMLRFETALAKVEESLGVIPDGSARRIAAAAESVSIDLAALGQGSLQAGHPVGALVEQLRDAAGNAGSYVHWGATAQDVVDSALILRLRSATAILDERLAKLIDAFGRHADRHRATVMAARTRSQQAVPTTFGLKAAGWIAPLLRHRRRLMELQPRLLVVQFGGAGGTLAALGDRGMDVTVALAAELELGAPPLPWHTQRDSIAEFAAWLSLLTGTLGKIGRDLALLAQTEVGEVSDGSAGSSSTMPQKSNPVLSEILTAAAAANAGLLAGMHQAMVQEQERGGSGWTSEWILLPQMVMLAGTSLKHARSIAKGLSPSPERMLQNLDASNGLLLAEAAVFALAAHLPKNQAQSLVSAACTEAAASNRHLADVLRDLSDAPVDWQRLRDPSNYLGMAERYIDSVLAKLERPPE